MPDGRAAGALARLGVDVVKAISMTRQRCAVRWTARGESSACRTRWSGRRVGRSAGKRLATLAREAGVEHFVYTSVGSAHSGRTSHTSTTSAHRGNRAWPPLPLACDLAPVFFMENLLAPSVSRAPPWLALGPGTKLQMIAVDDIGWLARVRS